MLPLLQNKKLSPAINNFRLVGLVECDLFCKSANYEKNLFIVCAQNTAQSWAQQYTSFSTGLHENVPQQPIVLDNDFCNALDSRNNGVPQLLLVCVLRVNQDKDYSIHVG